MNDHDVFPLFTGPIPNRVRKPRQTSIGTWCVITGAVGLAAWAFAFWLSLEPML